MPTFFRGVGICEISPPPVDTCAMRNGLPRTFKYRREPSVAATFLARPSWVSCVVASTLGGGVEELNQMAAPATARTTAAITTSQTQRDLSARAGAGSASVFPDV